MGWFDDNHWAGEAYNFGMGYMCGGGFSPEDSMSDDDFGNFGSSERCKGVTKAGKRCKITADSPYPTARTIAIHGYCSQHLNQGGIAPASSTNKRKREEPQNPLVAAASSGIVDDVKKELDSMQNDIQTLNIPVEVGSALLAAVREGHPEVVAELLCIGADVKALPGIQGAAEAALQDIQRLISSGIPRSAVRSALERRGRFECVKALLRSAAPLPSLPTVPSEPVVRDIESLTVEQLKAILRKHGTKLSGRKAELITRVKDGKYMEIELEEEVQKHQQLRQEASARRVEIQMQVAQRSASLRSTLRDCAPRIPTEAEVDALALPSAKSLKARRSTVPGACSECSGWLGRQNGKPPRCTAANCPGSKSASIGYTGMPFQKLLVSEMARSVPTPTRVQPGIAEPRIPIPGYVREMVPPHKKQRFMVDGKCVKCLDNTAAKACSVNMCGKCCKALNCARHR
eukprot:gnl/MRDRNA2_/MRDRNA2_213052_c0_seq1.p1 gnl/MRDRNA2_/MRDRNA2_213052_c0~~gnl/MRDRNA2_/MRDRNA2_213052_c0_seq1.p1  ORF type:complete len:459 (-),score=103.32 gnl/MRDRNA2_/MRDRNA2_213052_c0_seq1:132-1508(-)